jgi:hypothetical protein
MSLPTDLDGFYTEHRGCGELDAGVEGPTVWFDCECGARRFEKNVSGCGLEGNRPLRRTSDRATLHCAA